MLMDNNPTTPTPASDNPSPAPAPTPEPAQIDVSATKYPDKITKRNTLILFLCFLLVLGTTVWLLARPFILAQFIREYRTIDNIPTPTQIEKTGYTSLKGDGWTGTANYHALYTIKGLVVGIGDYNSDNLYDKISPRDISLAWGDMAAHNNLIKWTRGHREITASINALAQWYIDKDYRELFQQYSNNHLVFTDAEMLHKAEQVKTGDYIKITGYLVDVKAYLKNDPGITYELTTSLTRDDEGTASCEVVLVTDIEWLD